MVETDLPELIYTKLSADKGIVDKMARYAGQPAIFDSQIPIDQQSGWEGKEQYPRICYRVDMQANQERSSAGTLHITIYTRVDPLLNGELETSVKRCLRDVLMKPSGQAPFCVGWSRSEQLMVLDGMAVMYRDVVFDIFEYPAQQTTDPDPVLALSTAVKDLFPDAVVLGLDRIVGDYVETSEIPVVYCRIEDIQSTEGHCMNTINWFIARLAVHVLSPDYQTRIRMMAAIDHRLGADGEVIMLDQSPMTIQLTRINGRADYLREGQLMVTGKYGCLRHGEKKHNLVGVGMGFV